MASKFPGMQRSDIAVPSEIDMGGVLKGLQGSNTKDSLVAVLGTLGRRGEYGASSLGYAHLVADLMSHPEPEVVAAACDALSNMGSEGIAFVVRIGDLLQKESATIKAAAAGALGMFGEGGSDYKEELRQLIDAKEESVKAAAIASLGYLGDEDSARRIADHLKDPSSIIAAAACSALGTLEGGREYLEGIAEKLNDPVCRFAALNALLNHEDSAITPEIISDVIDKGLIDKDSTTRLTAASLIGNVEGEGSRNTGKIVELLKNQDPGVKCSAALTLGYMGTKAAEYTADVEALLDFQEEDESELHLLIGGGNPRAPPASRLPRCAALVALGMMDAAGSAGKVADALDDANWEVRMCALDALCSLGEAAVEHSAKIRKCLEDDIYVVRAKACECIAMVQATDLMSTLPELLEDPAPSVRIAALNALAKDPETAASYSNEVFKCMNDMQSNQVQAEAIRTLGCMKETGQSYASIIATMLIHEDPQLRAAACTALGQLGTYGAVFQEEVEYCTEDPDPFVRECAYESLMEMSGEGAEEEMKRLEP